MNRELKAAKNIINTILSQNYNIELLDSILKINSNDKKELLKHISALKEIFTKAEKQLKKELKSEVAYAKD